MALAVPPASLRHAGTASHHAGTAASIALHALALGVLLPMLPSRPAMQDAVPISVELVTAPMAPAPVRAGRRAVPPVGPNVARGLQVHEAGPAPQPAAPAVPAAAASPAHSPVTAPATQDATASPSPLARPETSQGTTTPAAADAPAVPVTPPIFNAAYLDNPAPAYPAQSRRVGEHGRVLLRVLVGAAGRADEVQVRGSSGSTRLDEAARDTVRRWRFVPARRGDEAVPAWVLVPISFSLGG